LENQKPQRLSSSTRLEIAPSRPAKSVDASTPAVSVQSAVAAQEYFVDAARAAAFLCCSRKHLLHLARTGQIPAYPMGGQSRKWWLFRLSELAAFVLRFGNNVSKMAAGRSSETETR
jgi:hypothetical protein